jgi:hypothetical protein
MLKLIIQKQQRGRKAFRRVYEDEVKVDDLEKLSPLYLLVPHFENLSAWLSYTIRQ